MLSITHRQTTAHHPESSGAIERLRHRLNDVLRAHITAATWAEEIHLLLLGLRAQMREDTGLSLAEAVFGAPIVLPNDFLQEDEISVDIISKKFPQSLDAPAFSLPRHNSSRQLQGELPADLLSARLVWVRAAVSSLLSTLSMTAPTLASARDTTPGRAAREDHCREPPQGVHGRERHAWESMMPH